MDYPVSVRVLSSVSVFGEFFEEVFEE
jgi:hypothetical protein